MGSCVLWEHVARVRFPPPLPHGSDGEWQLTGFYPAETEFDSLRTHHNRESYKGITSGSEPENCGSIPRSRANRPRRSMDEHSASTWHTCEFDSRRGLQSGEAKGEQSRFERDDMRFDTVPRSHALIAQRQSATPVS